MREIKKRAQRKRDKKQRSIFSLRRTHPRSPSVAQQPALCKEIATATPFDTISCYQHTGSELHCQLQAQQHSSKILARLV